MSIIGSTNAFGALKDLVSEGSPAIATVSSSHSDGTYTVTTKSGGSQRVRSSMVLGAEDQVLVQGDTVVSAAPSLSSSVISIG